jgi:DNA-binding transcriptional LysR family regulator
MEDELVLAVAADHPWAMQPAVPLAALPEQVFIQRERGSGSRLVVEQTLASAGLDPSRLQVIAEMATTEAIKQGIKAGLGISIISRLALEDEVRAGSICTVALADVTIQRPFSVIRHTGRSLSPLAQTFERFVRAFSPLDLSVRETLRHGG